VLDVYHACEKLAGVGQQLFGEQTAVARDWIDSCRAVLLEEGWPGIERALEATRRRLRSSRQRTLLQKVMNYLRPHAEHLHYRERLATGRTIGSGLVEGGCKQVIGRRLKQTGARWRREHVTRMATLCCTVYSDHWDPYWTSTAHNP
jgi:hypothetical protein